MHRHLQFLYYYDDSPHHFISIKFQIIIFLLELRNEEKNLKNKLTRIFLLHCVQLNYPQKIEILEYQQKILDLHLIKKPSIKNSYFYLPSQKSTWHKCYQKPLGMNDHTLASQITAIIAAQNTNAKKWIFCKIFESYITLLLKYFLSSSCHDYFLYKKHLNQQQLNF